jgi:hypothetical protein
VLNSINDSSSWPGLSHGCPVQLRRVENAIRTYRRHNQRSSWPDLFRPSTDPASAPEDVGTRDKHGHDERRLKSGGDLATIFREPDSRGLVPAIHAMPRRPRRFPWMPGSSPGMTKLWTRVSS